MTAPDDLTAELDAAEDIVTGRVEAVVTEWASRDLGGSAVFEMRYLGEEAARHVVEARNRNGVPCVLLRRTVTYGPWVKTP
jgi:hypothetical protein